MKLGDKVKIYTDNLHLDGLIGKIVAIDEGYQGMGTIKVLFDSLCQYNPITDKIIKHTDVEIRFNPEELKVIK